MRHETIPTRLCTVYGESRKYEHCARWEYKLELHWSAESKITAISNHGVLCQDRLADLTRGVTDQVKRRITMERIMETGDQQI